MDTVDVQHYMQVQSTSRQCVLPMKATTKGNVKCAKQQKEQQDIVEETIAGDGQTFEERSLDRRRGAEVHVL